MAHFENLIYPSKTRAQQQLGNGNKAGGFRQAIYSYHQKHLSHDQNISLDLPAPPLSSVDTSFKNNRLNESFQQRGNTNTNTPSTRSSKRYKVRVNRHSNVPEDFFHFDNQPKKALPAAQGHSSFADYLSSNCFTIKGLAAISQPSEETPRFNSNQGLSTNAEAATVRPFNSGNTQESKQPVAARQARIYRSYRSNTQHNATKMLQQIDQGDFLQGNKIVPSTIAAAVNQKQSLLECSNDWGLALSDSYCAGSIIARKRPLSVRNVRNRIAQQQRLSDKIAGLNNMQNVLDKLQQASEGAEGGTKSAQTNNNNTQHVRLNSLVKETAVDFTFKQSDFQKFKVQAGRQQQPQQKSHSVSSTENKENLGSLSLQQPSPPPSILMMMKKRNNFLSQNTPPQTLPLAEAWKNSTQQQSNSSPYDNFGSGGQHILSNAVVAGYSGGMKGTLQQALPPILSRKNSDVARRLDTTFQTAQKTAISLNGKKAPVEYGSGKCVSGVSSSNSSHCSSKMTENPYASIENSCVQQQKNCRRYAESAGHAQQPSSTGQKQRRQKQEYIVIDDQFEFANNEFIL